VVVSRARLRVTLDLVVVVAHLDSGRPAGHRAL
jgi:hypothetical protein